MVIIDMIGQTYNHYNCEQTGIDETTGEPILSRIVSEVSKPFFEMYDTNVDCVTGATTNYAYYKGIVPAVIFLICRNSYSITNKNKTR